MKFALDKSENYTVFALGEEKLNSVVAPELKAEMIGLNTVGVKNIILDLTELKYIDSSGLSAILIGNRLCQTAGGRLVLTNINEYAAKLIRISQLDSILKTTPTISEAKDLIMMDILEQEMKGSGEEE